MDNEKASERKTTNENEKSRNGNGAVDDIKSSFFMHLADYAGVSILLLLVNIFATPFYMWCLWVIVGWGVLVMIHTMTVNRLGYTTLETCPGLPGFYLENRDVDIPIEPGKTRLKSRSQGRISPRLTNTMVRV